MSGSVTPEFGIFIKVFVVLAVFLGIEYIAVIIKLSLYDSHSITWRIILCAITPVLIIISLAISNAMDNKAINVISIVLIAVGNLVYLLTPVTTHLSMLIYQGDNKIIATILSGLISISTSLLILVGLSGMVYWIIRILKF